MIYKIFKYSIDPVTRIAEMPRGQGLRVDYVDDGFYKGDYVWAIVDSNDKDKFDFPFPSSKWSKSPRPENLSFFEKKELKVKEKQEILSYGEPFYAEEDDGKMFVYCGETDRSYEKSHKIAVFKTGQKIDLPLEKMTYLGLNRLWIIQELGLYVFKYHE